VPLPELLAGRLSVLAIAAPMLLVSGPDLVAGVCRSGLAGTFPSTAPFIVVASLHGLSPRRDEYRNSPCAKQCNRVLA